MKVFIVKAPCGEYEDYQEPIVKVFLDKAKARAYVKSENDKLPIEQARKCDACYFKWECVGQKDKVKPDCFEGDKYGCCQQYFNKYRDVQKLFMEEYEVEE